MQLVCPNIKIEFYGAATIFINKLMYSVFESFSSFTSLASKLGAILS
ncbi:hypothetical protein BH10BAC3_BH10BAC3_12510 [soil metagenome]